MRIHYLQNRATAGIGNVGEWTEKHGHLLSGTLLYQGEALPPFSSFDILIILGGVPEECAAWLEEEIAFIAAAIRENKGVVGICLGSQLLAEALGGKLIPHTQAESGWLPVVQNEEGKKHSLMAGVNAINDLFFFHRNTFILPETCTLLAHTAGCANQIYTFGDRAIGIQSHPEMVAETIEFLAREEAKALPQGEYTQLNSSSCLQLQKLEGAKLMLATILNNLVKTISH